MGCWLEGKVHRVEQFPVVGFLLPQTQPLKLIMSTKYWDLYVYYVKKCERENYINDIDPVHYEMEWNHFWPQCIFGNWPVGNWLTVKQHAIASALQTLVYKENCMFGWHKNSLPPELLALAWPYYCEARVKSGTRGAAIVHAKKDKNGKSLLGLKLAEIVHAGKDENGKSLHTLQLHVEKDENGKSVHSKRTAAITHSKRNENGKSLVGIKAAAALNAERDKDGKSVKALKCHAIKDEGGKSLHAMKSAAIVHAEKDENGKSLHSLKCAAVTNSQIWQSTVDGFTSNASVVARHNRANGWPGEARVRLS